MRIYFNDKAPDYEYNGKVTIETLVDANNLLYDTKGSESDLDPES